MRALRVKEDTVLRVYDRCPGGRELSRRVAGPQRKLDQLRLRPADTHPGEELFAALHSGASLRRWEVDLVAWRKRSGFPCREPRRLFRWRSVHPTARPRGSDGTLSTFRIRLRDVTKRYRGLELTLDERFKRRGKRHGSISKVTYWRYSRARDRYVRYRSLVRRGGRSRRFIL